VFTAIWPKIEPPDEGASPLREVRPTENNIAYLDIWVWQYGTPAICDRFQSIQTPLHEIDEDRLSGARTE
jgi:hypothetical protein